LWLPASRALARREILLAMITRILSAPFRAVGRLLQGIGRLLTGRG
jgi:hypothetical protein